jgi:hypothetical protein
LDAVLTLYAIEEGWEYEKNFIVPHFNLFDLGIDQAVTKNENESSVFVLTRM